MNAVTIGPLMLSVDRLVALAGIVAFIVVTTLAARKSGDGIARWSTTGLILGTRRSADRTCRDPLEHILR